LCFVVPTGNGRLSRILGDDAYSVIGGGVVALSLPKGPAYIIIFLAIPKTPSGQINLLERKVALKLVKKL
jgi:hypothetical protein